jgi:NAD(P)-dependent dehydrogenase (short-subunit alcohol dehydrogenase family)
MQNRNKETGMARRVGMQNEWTGSVVIITGAASGIGRASVTAFTQAGATVIASDIAEGAEAVAAEAPPGTCIALRGDAGDEAHVAALIAEASRHGTLRGFFANAGITGGPVPLSEADPAQWLEVLRVNLIGPALALKHAAPVIGANGGGAITCTASVAGLRGGAGPAAYSASKAGVVNLVKVAALEFAGTKVRINAICPGLIETNMTKRHIDQARAAGFGNMVGSTNPSRRPGQPEEVAALALFLTSAAASFINGQAIAIDGGLTAIHPQTPRPAAAQAAAALIARPTQLN